MSPSLAGTERAALADLLETLGPDAPTLCEGWDTKDLAAHLVVRERRPDTLPGVVVGALARYTASVQDSFARRPYSELVRLVRTGPGLLSFFALPEMDRLFNTTEFTVHHEDIRRAQPGWAPRELPPKVQDSLWRAVPAPAKLAFRSLTCGVTLRRTDRPEAEPVSVASGSPVAELAGEPMELLLYAFGRRDHALVEVSGDENAIAELEAVSPGL